MEGVMVMLFYQFTGKLKEAPQVSDPMDARQARRAKAAMIKVKTDQYAELSLIHI